MTTEDTEALFSKLFKTDVDISQGSLETRVRWGGILNHQLIANLLLSVSVKECWKVINICCSYEKKFVWATCLVN